MNEELDEVEQPEIEQPEEAPERRSFASIALEFVIIFVIAYIIAYVLQNFIFGNFQIQQHSMEPTLYENERVLINRALYYFKDPERGDIVILLDPIGRQSDFVKRVVALPGDKIEVKGGRAYLNDKLLSESYLAKDGSQDNIGPIKIPQDQYFVMGDNRARSSDSRRFGPIPRKNILGKVFIVWWPLNRVHAPD